jgi:hypothetical protein
MLKLVADTNVIVAAMSDMTHYPLRLPHSLKRALKETVKEDGGSINQFIILAIAEKLSAMKTASFFEQAREDANLETLLQLLNRQAGQPHCVGPILKRIPRKQGGLI